MKLKIEIDARTYEVEVEVTEEDSGQGPPAPPRVGPGTAWAPPPALAGPTPAGGAEGPGCKSPIAGLVVKVLATVGQKVEINDPLLVLEAMKMESNITAPAPGTVTRINVKAGDPVQIGQTLIELE